MTITASSDNFFDIQFYFLEGFLLPAKSASFVWDSSELLHLLNGP
jgi:hypothetical protein